MKYSVILWLFWIPFIQILTLINTQLASSICLKDQQSLLLQLRRSLNFNASRSLRLASWNEASDCCQWNGVQCNSSTGHVIGIDLCGESITGAIGESSSLFSLQFLQSLNLANNSFSNAEIPPALGKLSGLTYLNLSNAGFVGQIPMEISQLVNLVTLDLSTSYFFGLGQLKLENPSLAALVRNLTNLRGLYLNGVSLSASGSEWCKTLSTSVPNLQYLSLSNSNLSGKIDPSLGNLHSLSEIRLDQNDLVAPVPDFIANFRNLTLLKLSSCNLIGTFPRKILMVPTLRSLDLSYNSLLQGTLPEYPLSASLQTLVLSYTDFSGLLPNSVGDLTQLQRIELVNCGFSGPIPSMERLNQLVHVDLSFNSFSGSIPSFSSAKNLKYLHLRDNMLSSSLASTDWASLSNLVDLDLSDNLLNGSIPKDLFSLPLLQQMVLSQNGFSGQLRELKNMSSSILNTLDLSNNKLNGSVPNPLLGLISLKTLKLSSNNFTGTFKLSVIQQLRNLSSFELSSNSLSVIVNDSANFSAFPQLSTLRLGSCNLSVLPEFLKYQFKLQYLDLSNNNISGAIPNWIWMVGNGSLASLNLSCNNFASLEQPFPQTPFLSVLDIHSNKIQGEIPALSSFTAVYLDYSHNNFTSISPHIGNSLVFTTYLSFSRNNISQEIPITLCNATTLQVLDMSYNLLNGTIPDCIIKMTSTLGVLNLRENKLTGTIISEFPGGCHLSTIDIGNNSLQGQVPRSLANCKLLEVLDLGNNQLSDTFPCWLRGSIKLRILVLRNNKFHGSIACKRSNTSWPMLQIVDIASNYFNGEITADCFSNLTALMTTGYDPQSSITQLLFPVLQLDSIYYQNMVIVTVKGTEVKLQKILTLFKCIDLSSNDFHGEIPEAIGNLSTLIVLNLSYNGFTGSIPFSIGNLSTLESLDLSHNKLSGSIPTQLTALNFLGVLNLSFNKLVGMIPRGTQLQSFEATSFTGNPGLCGAPLPKLCSSSEPSKTASVKESKSSLQEGFDWQFILLGSGFGTGAGLVIAPLMFWKRGRKWYITQVDKIAAVILSACGFNDTILYEGELRPEDGVGHQLFEIFSYIDDEDDDDDEDDMEGEGKHRKFCLFCSKLDIERKRVIHNPRCTCHAWSPILSSSASSSSK